MLYILCLMMLIFNLGNLILLLVMKMYLSISNRNSSKNKILDFKHMVLYLAISSMITLLPALSLINSNINFLNAHPVTIQILSLLSTAAIAVIYYFIFLRYGFKIIAPAGFISAVIIFCTYANNIIYVWPDNTGIVNITAIRTISEISDINCNADYILVKYPDNPNVATEWRCPIDIIFFINSSKPFIPFPDYISGKSSELSRSLYNLMHYSDAEAHR